MDILQIYYGYVMYILWIYCGYIPNLSVLKIPSGPHDVTDRQPWLRFQGPAALAAATPKPAPK